MVSLPFVNHEEKNYFKLKENIIVKDDQLGDTELLKPPNPISKSKSFISNV